MKRCFSKKQRIALELFSNGKCMLCGVQLPKSWHADHKLPFSKGGITDVINGQALCPQCNLKKGNSIMSSITLRNWQNTALTQATDNFSEGKKLFLTHATPGGGKTIHALSVFHKMMQDFGISHSVILAPSTVLVKQWQKDAKNVYDLELKNSMLYNQMSDFHEYSGMVMTYQGMNESHESLRIFCANNDVLVIADEIHHVADGQSWGDAFRNAFEPSRHILALTGTPWASEGKKISYVDYGKDGFATPDFSYKKETAIRDSVCRTTEFHEIEAKDLLFVDESTGTIIGEYATLQDAIDDEVKGSTQKTLRSIKHMKAMFIEADEQLSMLRGKGAPDAGGLIVAPDIRTAHEFQNELFMITGVEYPIVHSQAEKPHKKIDEFRDSSERWLISVDMVTEGVDIKRLQVCMFLSDKKTELFLRQVIGRIERIRSNEYIDRYGYFYHTDIPQINEIVGKLLEENKAGEALREQKEKEEYDGSGREKVDDSITLVDIRSEQKGLMAEGFYYEDRIVSLAIVKKRRSQILFDVPLFVICKVVMAEEEKEVNEKARQTHVPLTDKKERIRSRIAKEVTRKLRKLLGRLPTGKEIGGAHKSINAIVGIEKTNDSVSLDLLERKLEYIGKVEAKLWTA